MAESVGDIAIRLGADIAPFQRGMGQAQRSLGRFETSSQRMGRTLATVGRAGAAAIATMAAAGATLAVQAARTAVEVENLSRISQTSTTEFQRQAAAAETVGINAEKLADIFRDVTDRVGDFLATGGGPMADFFENIAPQVGVTADMFARLSGPEALQLYVSSLEAANVTQAEMTFYLEAMASDASNLTPLLRDNGRAMQELGDQAQRTGRVMSSETIVQGRELETLLRQISGTLRNSLNTALLESSSELNWLAEVAEDDLIPALNAAVPAIANVVAQIGEMAGTILSVGEAIDSMISRIPGGWDTLSSGINPLSGFGDVRDAWTEMMGRRRANYALDTEPTTNPHGPIYVPPTNNPHAPIYVPPPPPSTDPPPPPPPPGTGGGGGGGYSPFGGYEALQQELMTERELIQEEYELRLQALREYREAGGAIDDEYNETQRRVTEDHARRLREIEEQSRQERLAMAGDMMGSLATILEAGGNRNLGIIRGLRVAEAVIDGYSAAVSAWNAGMSVPGGGPILAAQYTAASLLRTGALISQMKNASTSSSGGGGGSITSGGASGGAAATSSNVAIQLHGETFGRGQVIDLINSINEAVEDGAVVRLV